MGLGVTFIIVAVAIGAIWILVEIKRMKHKLFAIFLILLIVFSYLSASAVFSGNDIDFKTVDGLVFAGRIYLSWLGGVFDNFVSLTGNAVNMDWTSTNNSMLFEEK